MDKEGRLRGEQERGELILVGDHDGEDTVGGGGSGRSAGGACCGLGSN
jgi:hypothetical protein